MIYLLRKISWKSKILVWALIFSLVGIGPSPDVMLCLQEDGKINVESACDCLFGNPEDQTTHTPFAPVVFSDHATSKDQCNPCVDIPLSFKSDIPIIRIQQKVFDVNSLAAFSTPYYLVSPVNAFNTEISFYTSHVINYSLSSLRTVVLLI